MSLPDGLDLFRPIPIQLGDEEQMLERAHDALVDVEPGDIAVLPEFLAWTPDASGRAFVTLVDIAQAHNISIITTLNLPPEVVEDLPGRDPSARYNAVCIFTRFGHVHVPQAKVTPQAFEMSPALSGPGIGVAPYGRVNRVRMDVGDALLDVRFLVCSDLWALTQLGPPSLACDLLVCPANFARGAEAHARDALSSLRASGAVGASLLVNAFHLPGDRARPPLAAQIDELIVAEERPSPMPETWPDAATMRDHFRVLDDAAARDFVSMVECPAREGRIAVARSLAARVLAPGEYPVTIAL